MSNWSLHIHLPSVSRATISFCGYNLRLPHPIYLGCVGIQEILILSTVTIVCIVVPSLLLSPTTTVLHLNMSVWPLRLFSSLFDAHIWQVCSLSIISFSWLGLILDTPVGSYIQFVPLGFVKRFFGLPVARKKKKKNFIYIPPPQNVPHFSTTTPQVEIR